MTRDQVMRLIISARGDPLEAAYVLAVMLGMRQGELRTLHWNAIRLDERRLVARRNATRTIDNQQVISLPKTQARHRTLRLPEVAVEALMRTPHRSELLWPGTRRQSDARRLPLHALGVDAPARRHHLG